MATNKNHRTSTPTSKNDWAALHPTEHGEFTAGDTVKVASTMKSTWTFAYANLRKDGTLDSYTVMGGSAHGTQQTKEFRSFAPERVTLAKSPAPRTPKSRKAS